MAFLGDFGKIFLGGANTATAVGALTGNPMLALAAQKGADAVSNIRTSARSQTGQNVAVDRASEPPAETKMSGESGGTFNQTIVTGRTTGGIVPASYGMNVPPAADRAVVQQTSLPAIVGGGLTTGRGIMNMLGLAGGAITVAPIIIDPLTGQEKKLRVTRKLRSDVKKAVEMFGVDFVADQMGTTVDVVFYILTKKMRNDGPYVTKAAVRKTRQTVRKMKHLCDMYDDLRPPARRRAPTRKTSTSITNVK